MICTMGNLIKKGLGAKSELAFVEYKTEEMSLEDCFI